MLKQKEASNVRNSSIELLRIISMLMIVFHHFAIHGGFEWGADSISITRFWYNFIFIGGQIGVDIFVLISGYYLIKSSVKVLNFKKIFKFWIQVLFYSITIFLAFLIFGRIDIGIIDFIKICFPITFSQWWFASTYFVLYLLHPFINKLLYSLDKAMFQKCIFLLIVCWSIIPTFTTVSFESNSLLWFITLYAIAGYINLYGLNNKFKLKHYVLFFIISFILTYSSSLIFTLLGGVCNIFSEHATYFYGQEKITVLMISVCLFMIFINIKMNYYKWINVISSATFGVYLIHDNIFVRNFLWLDLFKNFRYQDSLFLIPYSIFVVIIVYVVCSLIELLRQYVVDKSVFLIVDRYSSKLLIPFKFIFILFKNVIFGKDN